MLPSPACAVDLAPIRQAAALVRKYALMQTPLLHSPEERARQPAHEAGTTFISPFDDPYVDGGTVGPDLLQQPRYCSAVVVPVGGRGLASDHERQRQVLRG